MVDIVLYTANFPFSGRWFQVLKEEIYRVLELEAENAVLQESLRSLPQLQQDRAALLSMRDRKVQFHSLNATDLKAFMMKLMKSVTILYESFTMHALVLIIFV